VPFSILVEVLTVQSDLIGFAAKRVAVVGRRLFDGVHPLRFVTERSRRLCACVHVSFGVNDANSDRIFMDLANSRGDFEWPLKNANRQRGHSPVSD
jgi:hypothetical protein